jgi:hypothetical protein
MAMINASVVADVPTYHGDNYVSNMLKIRNMVTVRNSSECSYITHHCIIQDFVTVMQQIKLQKVAMLNSSVPVAISCSVTHFNPLNSSDKLPLQIYNLKPS